MLTEDQAMGDLIAVFAIFAAIALYFWGVKSGFLERHLWGTIIATFAMIWIGYLFLLPHDWVSVAIGLGTGCLLAGWAMERTGGKTPDFMVRSARLLTRQDSQE